MTDNEPQCWRCSRVLAEYLSRPWSMKCKRCHAQNKSEPIDKKVNVT